jgi:hypothetical protein
MRPELPAATRRSAAALAACAALTVAAQPHAPQWQRPAAEVRLDSAARGATPREAALAAVRARRGDAAALLEVARERAGRHGMRHVELRQRVDGLVVHGAYARVAVRADGRVAHLIDATVPVRRGTVLAAAAVDEAAALGAAMARVHPGVGVPARAVGREGITTRFERGSFFHAEPRVRPVAVAGRDGHVARGWLVQTWSERTNLLHHVLVAGDGRVLEVERRTSADSYRVFDIDPGKSAQAVVQGPGTGNAASPAGWLTGRMQNTTNIQGNNVRAYLDKDANNRRDMGGTRVMTGRFLTTANLAETPESTANKNVAVQNLFYLNNRLHDVLRPLGFDEAAGNFQADNFGLGGLGNDAVNAEAQDGSGFNNANFATPPDGQAPRMQMFLWDGPAPTHEVVLSNPAAVTYGAKEASFTPNYLDTTGDSGAIVLTEPADACTTLANAAAIAGKLALIDRGTCSFVDKVNRAQAAGATGVIVANNVNGDEIIVMGGTPTQPIFVAAVMISQNDGAALKALAAPAGTMREKAEQPIRLDSSLDSDVVYHEYGHGLTWRMIDNMSGPMSGALGEGASDALALLMNGDDRVGEYASGRPGGIRRHPYTAYPLHYGNMAGTSVHGDGEAYAAIIWRLTELMGPARRADVLAYFVDAMNYIPAGPAYEHMRDGMLQAVANGPMPSDRCTVWTAFAQYGVGVGASGTFVGSTPQITPSFTTPGDCP